MSSHTQTPFVHQGLDMSQQQIRLLRLQAGRYESPDDLTPRLIECEIRHFNFETHPPYRAVSYTWGDPDTTIAIILNGYQYHVRDNLWQFLDVARDKFENKWLWIDALCIDQENVGERNHQVQLMRDIFSGALKVVSWLGSAAEESDAFMELVECYSAYSRLGDTFAPKTTFLAPPTSKPGEKTLATGSQKTVSCVTKDSEHRTTEQRLSRLFGRSEWAISAFLHRPYWQRIWIVQEVRFAKSHLIMCGRRTASSSDLNHFITQMKERVAETAQSKYWSPYPYAVLNPPSTLTEFSLSNVIRTYRNSKCSDLRDRVYGIMSLVNERTTIPIDYSKSTFELFFVTLGKVIQTEWGHETKDAKEFPDQLRKALGLDDTAVNPDFVRLFVQCGIKYRPRLLTLERWLEIVERRKKRVVT